MVGRNGYCKSISLQHRNWSELGQHTVQSPAIPMFFPLSAKAFVIRTCHGLPLVHNTVHTARQLHDVLQLIFAPLAIPSSNTHTAVRVSLEAQCMTGTGLLGKAVAAAAQQRNTSDGNVGHDQKWCVQRLSGNSCGRILNTLVGNLFPPHTHTHHSAAYQATRRHDWQWLTLNMKSGAVGLPWSVTVKVNTRFS